MAYKMFFLGLTIYVPFSLYAKILSKKPLFFHPWC